MGVPRFPDFPDLIRFPRFPEQMVHYPFFRLLRQKLMDIITIKYTNNIMVIVISTRIILIYVTVMLGKYSAFFELNVRLP